MKNRRTYILCIGVFIVILGIATAFSYLTWSVACRVSVETFSGTQLETQLAQYRSGEKDFSAENLVGIRQTLDIQKHFGYLGVRYNPIPFSGPQEGIIEIFQKGIGEKPSTLGSKGTSGEYFIVTSEENKENFLAPEYEVQSTMNNRDFKKTACMLK